MQRYEKIDETSKKTKDICLFSEFILLIKTPKYIPKIQREYFCDTKCLVLNKIIIFLIQNIQFCRMGIFSCFKIFRFVSNHYFQITKNIPILFWEYILDSKNLDLNQGNNFLTYFSAI